MQYKQACSYLESLQLFKIKLGLEAMTSLLDILGSPHEAYPTVHLAGTNGKGSVASMLVALLAGSGFKVGLYTSPHLQSVRERFRINDRIITRDAFTGLSSLLKEKLGDRKITYFEFTTALAFLWFQDEEVDIAIIETGLGGRLDATNVLTPLVSVITTIDFDHQEYLGNTLQEIAGEKAGIVKHGIPVVAGALPLEAQDVLQKVCAENDTMLFSYGVDYTTHNHGRGIFDYHSGNHPPLRGLSSGLIGTHQVTNAAIALKSIEILKQHGFSVSGKTALSALAEVKWPGRMEILRAAPLGRERLFLLDGAHNSAGVRVLLETIDEYFPDKRLVLIWGNMADKSIEEDWFELLDKAATVILSQAESKRSATPQALVEAAPPCYGNRLRISLTVEDAVHAATDAAKRQDLICVAGSLYLVGKVRSLLLTDTPEY